MQPKAIPTVYKGVQFKSRLEADVAFFLDGIGCKWEYEPVSFLLDNGVHYWPDFWLPEQRVWIEVRGYSTPKGEKQIEGFAEWIKQGRLDREMTPINWDDLDEDDPDDGPERNELVHYAVIRGDGWSRYYFDGWWELPPEFTGIQPCPHCQRWTFLLADCSFQICRYCNGRMESYGNPLLVSIGCEKGTLLVKDRMQIFAARDWVSFWRQWVKERANKRVVYCGNTRCHRSTLVSQKGDIPSGWFQLHHQRMNDVVTYHYCGHECLSQDTLRDFCRYQADPQIISAVQMLSRSIDVEHPEDNWRTVLPQSDILETTQAYEAQQAALKGGKE